MGYLESKLDDVVAVVTEEAARTRARLESATAETIRGVRLDGALPRPFRPNAQQYTAAGRLVGWSLRAVTADVTITFRDGNSPDADPVASTVVKAGTSDTQPMPGAGVSFVDGLFADVTTAGGSIVGAVWIGAVD